MPRVHHVKKARKDNPAVKAGESYYWWKFRYGGKQYSKTPPKPSQLTQSPYFSGIRSLVEMIEEREVRDGVQLEELRDEVRDELESLQSEAQDSFDNMPDSLQYGPTGEMLQERVDACDSAISDLDMIDEFEFEEEAFEEKYSDDDFADDKEREEMIDQHEMDEDNRRNDELIEWCEEKVSELIEYVSNCEV